MIDPNKPTVLQINGLIMRSLQLSDLDTLAAIWSYREVTRFLPSRGIPIPKEDVKKSIESFVQHWQQREYDYEKQIHIFNLDVLYSSLTDDAHNAIN